MVSYWTTLDDHQQTVVQHPILSDALYRADAVVYDAILTYLNDNSFTAMQQSVRTSLQKLAHKLEQYTVTALRAFPAEFVSCRVELASRTAHLLSRHLGIVQLVRLLYC